MKSVVPHGVKISVVDAKKKELVESFKSKARSIGADRFFWDKMIDALCNGEIGGIDPLNSLKEHKSLDLISSDLHEIIIGEGQPYKDASADLRAMYLLIIKTVNQGLRY